MEQSERGDVWAAGDLYEPFIGRWSRRVARDFVEWLAVGDGSDWLDVGCGTGALTQTILDHASPRSVKGVDPSAAFIGHAQAHITSGPVTFDVGDAQSLPIETASVDVVVAGLSLNFVPKPRRAVMEMTRVLRAGGTAAAYVWDYAGKMELLRYFWDAAVALNAAARDLDEGRRFPICQPEALATHFEEAGLHDVEVRGFDASTVFRDFDDYWSPFLGAQGPAPGYAMSLTDEDRSGLRDRLRSTLPTENDGSIRLIARAWAVRGHARH